ncbi:hypothetical protein B0H16DRAFT_1594526 [Mycena metata]|uniref:BTB domain-containing protein n=1 Tax=Mycena metata TaxID=1033252 RepID=A0AAD7MNU2_9AGAR|nr:hypothetical protein B0H16DRAFT_1594526 [Mycena metata]
MHSSVFRDMFTIPLPSDEAMVEGCAVVVLQGDTVRDWCLLLRAVFPKGLPDEVPSIDVIAAILRLSKKYDFPIFRKNCVDRLKGEFPASLEEYDDLDDWTYISGNCDGNVCMLLISLAREIGVYSVLPLSFALIVQEDMLEVLRSDVALSSDDRLACLTGYFNLLKLQSTTTMAWLGLGSKSHIPCSNCLQPSKCPAAVKEIALKTLKSNPPELRVTRRWLEEWDKEMCRHCRKTAKDIYDTGRDTCWTQLPAAFGLPSWEELKSMDFE